MLSGEEFKRLRMSRGLSLTDLAKYTGKTKACISQYEHDKIPVSDELYEKLLEGIYMLPKKD